MAKPSEIRAGLVAAVQAATGIRVYPRWIEDPTVPCFMVDWDDPAIEYDLSMGNGLNRFNFTMKALAGKVDDDAAQQLLDTFIDTTSATALKAAVRQDYTLGGVVSDLRITMVTQFGTTLVAGIQVISAIFHIIVYAP